MNNVKNTKVKFSLYIAYTKDGFIATKNHSVDFLNNLNIVGDAGYQEYFNSVDTLIFGSSTYKFIINSGVEWPYKNKKSFVLTSHPENFEDVRVTFLNGDVNKISSQLPIDTKNVWVMGGANVISQFIDNDLISEMILSEVNIEIKDGIKLFENWEKVMDNFKEVKTRNFGDITNHYYEHK